MSNQRNLKAFVRFDGSGRVVAGSLVLRKNKPKVGRWREIQAYECCNYVPTTTTTSSTSTTTTTTTAAVIVYSFEGSWSFMDRAEACIGLNVSTYYSTTPVGSVTSGTQLYTNAGLTTTPTQPYIKIGVNSYQNSAGLLSNINPC